VTRVLDVSELVPPEPLERILAALDELGRGEELLVRHRREPFPLYNLLRNMGFDWETGYQDERFQVRIWRPTDPAGRR
jgi:uncharacterized protein (DUF2249 family)